MGTKRKLRKAKYSSVPISIGKSLPLGAHAQSNQMNLVDTKVKGSNDVRGAVTSTISSTSRDVLPFALMSDLDGSIARSCDSPSLTSRNCKFVHFSGCTPLVHCGHRYLALSLAVIADV